MDLVTAHRMAVDLVAEHGLSGWRVEFDRAKTRAGVCRYDRRTIGLSRVLTQLHSEADVRDTVLHEIAHALAGPKAGHGPEWRSVARQIGCTAQRCVPETAPRAPAPWTGVCPAGHTAQRHQAPTRVVSCRRCSTSFSADALFEWRWHGRTVTMHPNYVAELQRLRAREQHGGPESEARPAPGPPVLTTQPGKTRQAAAPTAFPVGARVVITAPGRFEGTLGVVAKRGRTRYHLRTQAGVVTVPFALVQSANAGAGSASSR